MRAEVAKILASWDAAKVQVAREDTARAEAKASLIDRPATTMEHTYVKSAYEKLYGRLQGEETPSR
eukprot:535538-Karenia_brevis.AAC.1